MKNKLCSRRGETLIETLAALVVIVLALTMLAGGVVAAAKQNKAAGEVVTVASLGGAGGTSAEGVKLTVNDAESDITVQVKYYGGEDGAGRLYYYEVS